MSQDASKASDTTGLSRRRFLGRAMAAAAVAPALGATLDGAAEQPQQVVVKGEITRRIKVGIIGCGARGAWFADLFRNHGGFEVHALADYFQETVDAVGDAAGVDRSRRFSGLSGYKRLLESGVEAVVIEDVPYFYPEQVQAAVEAGKHIFMAKPVAVDVPGVRVIEAAARKAAAARQIFLVDYQLLRMEANLEVVRRIQAGALNGLGHVMSFGIVDPWGDPPKGDTIESRLHGYWYSDVALGGDNPLTFDIHILEAVVYVLGRPPVSACGYSRICRRDPHGDRSDCGGVVYRFDDGVIWTHMSHAMRTDNTLETLSANFYGLEATAHIQYGGGGKAFVRGGPQHYVGTVDGQIFLLGAEINIAKFYQSIMQGEAIDLPTIERVVDGTLTGILGREAMTRGGVLTMEELLREERKLEVDLHGLKA